MLEDISQHLADIAENGVNAGATEIRVSLNECSNEGWLVLQVEDNGRGMDEEMVRKVTDPFTTSRTTRRVGLGIPFLKQVAELCQGELRIASTPGKGTRITALLRADALDCPPLGNVALSIMSLFAGHPKICWSFCLARGDKSFSLSWNELMEELEDPQLLCTPEISAWIRETVEEGLKEIRS